MKAVKFKTLLRFVYSAIVCIFTNNSSVNAQSQAPQPHEVVSGNTRSVKVYDINNFAQFLSPVDDTVYVFNFWATWCEPCLKELPYFDRLAGYFKNKKIKTIFVSMDFRSKIKELLIPYIEANNIHSDVIVLNASDTKLLNSKVDSAWSGALPATLILKGNQKSFYTKSFTELELQKVMINFMLK